MSNGEVSQTKREILRLFLDSPEQNFGIVLDSPGLNFGVIFGQSGTEFAGLFWAVPRLIFRTVIGPCVLFVCVIPKS